MSPLKNNNLNSELPPETQPAHAPDQTLEKSKFVQTFEPYKQSSPSNTHHSSGGRSGGRACGGAHRSSMNNEIYDVQERMIPTQQRNVKRRKKTKRTTTRNE